MITEKHRKKTWLDPVKLFGLFPRANLLYHASLAAFAICNGILLIVSKVDPAILSSWIKLSQPVTASIAHVFPAIDWAAGELEKSGGGDLIPAVRNVLAFDFILFLLFQILIILASLLDLGQYRMRICAGVDALILATSRSLLWFVVVYGLFTATIAVHIYLEIGVRPFGFSLQTNYVYFAFDFLALDAAVAASVVITILHYLRRRSAT